MAVIEFYEKPNCINGEKQKRILEKAGNTLKCINILQHPWTEDELTPFIQGKNPTQFMNYTAPAIKKGEIKPEELSYEEAVSLMVANPILIKRPLLRIEDMSVQGFLNKRLTPYLGSWDGQEDVVTCPNLQTIPCDAETK